MRNTLFDMFKGNIREMTKFADADTDMGIPADAIRFAEADTDMGIPDDVMEDGDTEFHPHFDHDGDTQIFPREQ